MKIAVLGSQKYENSRKIKDFIYKIKEAYGSRATIITRGMRHGCERWAKMYALEFGLGYIEYNPAHTSRNLYSGMRGDYYDKPYHPTQRIHQIECSVTNSDKVVYFGGIRPSDRKFLEKIAKRWRKNIVYVA